MLPARVEVVCIVPISECPILPKLLAVWMAERRLASVGDPDDCISLATMIMVEEEEASEGPPCKNAVSMGCASRGEEVTAPETATGFAVTRVEEDDGAEFRVGGVVVDAEQLGVNVQTSLRMTCLKLVNVVTSRDVTVFATAAHSAQKPPFCRDLMEASTERC
jgi:hypothetical protein